MVNSDGKGFKTVTGLVVVQAGATVMVAPGSAASVVYEGGCVVPVEAGKVTSVQFVPPCASAMQAPSKSKKKNDEAHEGAHGDADDNRVDDFRERLFSSDRLRIAGIALGVGGIAYLIIRDGQGNGAPASP